MLFIIAALMFILVSFMFPPSLLLSVPLIAVVLVLKALTGTIRWGVGRR
jgi:hypothetical protein